MGILIVLGCIVLIWIMVTCFSFCLPTSQRQQPIKYLAYILIVGGMLNFVSFFIVALCIGGDAVGNPPVNGKYYVSEHGHRTEVSRRVYEYSLFHAHSVWVTHPLIFIGGFILYSEDKDRKQRPTT